MQCSSRSTDTDHYLHFCFSTMMAVALTILVGRGLYKTIDKRRKGRTERRRTVGEATSGQPIAEPSTSHARRRHRTRRRAQHHRRNNREFDDGEYVVSASTPPPPYTRPCTPPPAITVIYEEDEESTAGVSRRTAAVVENDRASTRTITSGNNETLAGQRGDGLESEESLITRRNAAIDALDFENTSSVENDVGGPQGEDAVASGSCKRID
jgi:hypothetical protein